MRGQVGTGAFWRAIREYHRRHQNGLASSEDLQRAFEETSGQDLERFFTQWLHWPTVPAVEGAWWWDDAGRKVVNQLTDVLLDPNTWMLMEPPKFSRRQR